MESSATRGNCNHLVVSLAQKLIVGVLGRKGGRGRAREKVRKGAEQTGRKKEDETEGKGGIV